jgi:hypothetical protein
VSEIVRCKACMAETVTADETGLCAPCRVLKACLQEDLDCNCKSFERKNPDGIHN